MQGLVHSQLEMMNKLYKNEICRMLQEKAPNSKVIFIISINKPAIYRIYVPRANLSWFETETNWSTIYTQSHIVAIEDYIEYLESIGFNVDAYKEATA